MQVCSRAWLAAGVAAIMGGLPAGVQAPPAAGEAVARTVTIRVAVVYQGLPSAVWRGTFVSVLSTGRVVDRGTVVDRPRQRFGVNWAITRTLVGRSGTLRFHIVGPYRTPVATLKWVILGGTGSYAGLMGTGTDVEHVARSRVNALMTGVPVR
jgi:hypothetical protein